MVITSRFIAAALILMLGLPGCSTDIYRAQSESLQIHAQKFQSFLHREQVEAAMHENHAIELIGLQLKGGRLPGSDTLKPADLERQAHLLDAVREQSAVNWVAMAQYFSSRQQYGAARALYQRVIQSYAKGGDRLYAEYAKQALTDMDILVMGHGAHEVPVSSPALSALQDTRHP
ncbi:MAG: hypothetical protein M3Z35_08655 [Nitrospirota bacterium]|nr:hypothetical protein [Nitrospirota bacterium]